MPPIPLPLSRRTIAEVLSDDEFEALLLSFQDASPSLYSVVAITMRECITAVSQRQCCNERIRPRRVTRLQMLR